MSLKIVVFVLMDSVSVLAIGGVFLVLPVRFYVFSRLNSNQLLVTHLVEITQILSVESALTDSVSANLNGLALVVLSVCFFFFFTRVVL